MESIAKTSVWVYFLSLASFLISCDEETRVANPQTIVCEVNNLHAQRFLQQIQKENEYNSFLALTKGNVPLYEFVQLSSSSIYGSYFFIPCLGSDDTVECGVYYPVSIPDSCKHRFAPFLLTSRKLNEEIPISDRFLYSAKFKHLQTLGLKVDARLVEFAELLEDTIIHIPSYELPLPKATRSGSSLHLSIGYDATYIGGKTDAIYGLSLQTFLNVAISQVGRYFPGTVAIRALVNPIIMLAPLGNVFGVEATLREIARGIERECFMFGFSVFVQYSYSITASSWGGGGSNSGSSGTGGGGGSLGGSSSSGDNDSGNESQTLPDTCKHINDVKRCIVKLLHENDVVIDPEKIREPTCGCLSNARKKDGLIEVCPLFYGWGIKDQYSILWHEVYHLRNDIPTIQDVQPLPEVVQLVPDNIIRNYMYRFALKELEGLILPNERRAKIMQDYVREYSSVESVCSPDYYLNEINAYRAEMATNKDVSEYYRITRNTCIGKARSYIK